MLRASRVSSFDPERDLPRRGPVPGASGIAGLQDIYDRADKLEAGQKLVVTADEGDDLCGRAFASLRARAARGSEWKVSVFRAENKLIVYRPADD